jgi:alginate O-acetyltransferase complex protein AlgI
LGGNNASPIKRNFNLLVTFLVSGLWHGANYTFIIWGFLHGSGVIIEKTVKKINVHKVVRIILVFIAVSWFFTLFRSPDLSHFITYSRALFNFGNAPFASPFLQIESNWFFIFPASFFIWMEMRLYSRNSLCHANNNYAVNVLLFVCIVLFAVFENAPKFIYFQF